MRGPPHLPSQRQAVLQVTSLLRVCYYKISCNFAECPSLPVILLDLPAAEEPAQSILNVAALISFDLELLKVACVMGVNPLRSFAFRQLLPVLLIPVALITLLVKKHAPKCGKSATPIWMELYNSLGTFFSVFFISILISALDPFICYEHPGDAGESVRSAPSLLCFEGSLALLLYWSII